MNESTNGTRKTFNYGWIMVMVAPIFIGLGLGILGAISVYMKPLIADMGWLRGETAFAYLVGTTSLGLGGIFMGYLADRFSIRLVAIIGTLCLGGSLLLLSRQQSLWQFYLYYCLLGGLGVSAFHAPMLANVGSWFDRNKGLALGIATAAVAAGQSGVPYFSQYLITAVGWRETYLILGMILLAVLLPLSLLMRNPPGLERSVAGAKALPSSKGEGVLPIAPVTAVAWISVAVVFCCFVMATPLVHVVALAQDLGIDAQSAAGLVSLIWATGIVGRIIFGKLSDHIGGIRSWLLASAIQTVFVFWFVRMETLGGLYILGILFGIGFSGVMTSFTICIREMVPLHMRGVSMGIVFFFAWSGMGLGGWQGGYFFDQTGDYGLSFINAAAAGVINLAIVGALWMYVTRRRSIVATRLQPAS